MRTYNDANLVWGATESVAMVDGDRCSGALIFCRRRPLAQYPQRGADGGAPGTIMRGTAAGPYQTPKICRRDWFKVTQNRGDGIFFWFFSFLYLSLISLASTSRTTSANTHKSSQCWTSKILSLSAAVTRKKLKTARPVEAPRWNLLTRLSHCGREREPVTKTPMSLASRIPLMY